MIDQIKVGDTVMVNLTGHKFHSVAGQVISIHSDPGGRTARIQFEQTSMNVSLCYLRQDAISRLADLA